MVVPVPLIVVPQQPRADQIDQEADHRHAYGFPKIDSHGRLEAQITIKPSVKGGMPLWQDRVFIGLARNASNATEYFQLPTSRVVELGIQVTI